MEDELFGRGFVVIHNSFTYFHSFILSFIYNFNLTQVLSSCLVEEDEIKGRQSDVLDSPSPTSMMNKNN